MRLNDDDQGHAFLPERDCILYNRMHKNKHTHTHTDMSKSHYANVVKHAEATAAPLAAVRHLCKWSEY